MRVVRFALFAPLVALVFSCSTDHKNLPTSFEYTPPPTPTNLTAAGGEERSTLSWEYPAEARTTIKEFRVYEYLPSYDLLELVGTTTDTVFIDSLLIGNLMYCYKVSAVDTTGLEGWRSAAVCTLVKTAH
jgi:hypothetical protein